MFNRSMLLGLFALTIGCGDALSPAGEDGELARTTQALSTNASQALSWANGWIDDVKAQPGNLAENVYTTSSPALVKMAAGVSARNRSVCGTLITMLIQNSTSLTSGNFFNSFNKAMDGTCGVGYADKEKTIQLGTSSPNAAQYRYKIARCASTGPVKFTARADIAHIEAGDVLAVDFPERTDISGHVMLVRSVPVADSTLPAGPTDSTAYAVEVIDSTSTPHGTSTTYPDWRGGNTGQGLGTGTFVLYTDATGAIVATRWSPTDPDLYDTTAHPVAVGGLL